MGIILILLMAILDKLWGTCHILLMDILDNLWVIFNILLMDILDMAITKVCSEAGRGVARFHGVALRERRRDGPEK